MQTISVAETSKSPAMSGLLYRPLDFVIVRAPLLPVESYRSLADEESQLSLLADPRARRALAVGSTSLLATLERFKQSGLTRRDEERMRAKLLRYQIRMATRPTPFGLFAGVALGSWGTVTDLSIRSTCAVTRTRPDMAWLMAFVMSLEANPAIRKQLSYYANPLAMIEAGRVALAERAPTRNSGPPLPVSVRATTAVRQALSLARRPIPYELLVARLCETTTSATPEKVEKLLTQLWEQTFLLTDLRPPLTSDSPARYVTERLACIPEAADELTRLNKFLDAASAWDRMEPEESLEAFGSLLEHAGVPPDKSRETPIQVDMALAVKGHLGEALAVEAARAVELSLRLSPMPRGLSSLAAYRQSFINRYGHDREVPLLELLDPHRGLGAPSAHGHAPAGTNPTKAAQRAQTLLHLACAALHKRQRVVHLDEDCLTRLETWRPNAETAPLSLDINMLVAARSAAAIDSGDFTVVIGPNLGAMAAGRNLGRFADLLGPDGLKVLEQVAVAEQAHAPDQLWAELVYLPSNFRSANVVIRPPVRPYEVALGVTAGVPTSYVIPLDELVVGVEHDCFYVRWPAAGKRVTFSSGNMLSLYNAPPVGRFLIELSNDGKAVFSTFDWGLVENFPYLPRVQAGRIVLRPAQWRIQKDDLTIETPESYRRSLDLWRAEWDMPRHVFLSIGDNRLVLDLDEVSQAAELKVELKNLTGGGSLIVQEVLPSLDEAWLPGPGGHYYSEFTVSLALRDDVSSSVRPSIAHAGRTSASSVIAASVTEQHDGQPLRNYPPGSEWLFVKLYCPRNLEDDVISGSMSTFAENVTASGLADSWFFIRYADPDAHLRLRFHGPPERLTGQLFGHVCDWAGRLMSDALCLKFTFDTYEREVERFGGLAGMAAAEALFSVDSRHTAELLRYSKAKQWSHDRTTLLAVSIDDLLGGMGFSEEERLRWYRSQATLGRATTSSEYRQRKNVLRSLLGKPEALANEPGGAEIAGVFKARREALAPVVDCLRQLTDRGEMGQSLDGLCASFVHLHVNRLGGFDSLSEQWLLSLLLRTLEGLRKSPVAQPVPQ
jgi:thiopeptide-type bacteriocin biosynthesis protein